MSDRGDWAVWSREGPGRAEGPSAADDEVVTKGRIRSSDATSPHVQPRSRPFRWGLVAGLVVGLVVAVGTGVVVHNRQSRTLSTLVDLGPQASFSPSGPTMIDARGRHFIVMSDGGAPVAFVNRSTVLGCRLVDISGSRRPGRIPPHIPASAWLLDPCHFAAYDRDGACVAQPCPFGLLRMTTKVTAEGRVAADVATIEMGPVPRP